MAKLTAAKRNALPKADFGLVANGKEKYPVNDKSHAANAKSRASQAVKVGRMSTATEQKIDAKANRVLGESGDKPKADAGGSKARGGRGNATGAHLEAAAYHRAMADTHREAADKHVEAAVNSAAKSVSGMKPDAKDSLRMGVQYGAGMSPGLGEAVAVARGRR